MSDCNPNPDCNPCQTVQVNESVASQIENLTASMFGTFTKTIVNGRAVWTLQCDPNTGGIAGIPRNAGEGFVCYILRVLAVLSIVPGPPGPPGAPGSAVNANYAIRTISTNLVAVAADQVIFAELVASITVTLPLVSSLTAGKWYAVWVDGAATTLKKVTVLPSGADTINDAANWTLDTPRESVTFVSNGVSKWRAI